MTKVKDTVSVHLYRTGDGGWEAGNKIGFDNRRRFTVRVAAVGWHIHDRLTDESTTVNCKTLDDVRIWIKKQVTAYARNSGLQVARQLNALRCELDTPCDACGAQEATFRLVMFPVDGDIYQGTVIDSRKLCTDCTQGSGFATPVEKTAQVKS